ncbi:hypothetical protein QUF76_03245 [Desulfobacterales bacterium HSG16]|nr:hypothetical protein [Desulfobacterales bacterium HSG16]
MGSLLKSAVRKKIIKMPVSSDFYYGLFYPFPFVFFFIFYGLASMGTIITILLYQHGIKLWPVLPFIIAILLVLFFLSRIFFKEHLIITQKILIHQGPKIDGSPEKIFELKNFEFILWIGEIRSETVTYHYLYLVDKKGVPNVLINENSNILSIKDWNAFLDKLSYETRLPISREFYKVNEQSGEKTKISHETDKWKFLPRTASMAFESFEKNGADKT